MNTLGTPCWTRDSPVSIDAELSQPDVLDRAGQGNWSASLIFCKDKSWITKTRDNQRKKLGTLGENHGNMGRLILDMKQNCWISSMFSSLGRDIVLQRLLNCWQVEICFTIFKSDICNVWHDFPEHHSPPQSLIFNCGQAFLETATFQSPWVNMI